MITEVICGILALQFINAYFYLAARLCVYGHENKLFVVDSFLPSLLHSFTFSLNICHVSFHCI